MVSAYECEVRFSINDINMFRERLDQLEAKVEFNYSFHDHYFKPINSNWSLLEKNIRIREWFYPRHESYVYLVKNEVISIGDLKFKRSLFKEGKLNLFTANYNECSLLLFDLGFLPWFTVKKEDSTFYDIKKYDFKSVTEYIPEIGWSGEIESSGENPEKAKEEISRIIGLLQIPEHEVTFKPIGLIYAEAHSLV